MDNKVAFFFSFYLHEVQLEIAPNMDFTGLFVGSTGVFLAVQHRRMLNSLCFLSYKFVLQDRPLPACVAPVII